MASLCLSRCPGSNTHTAHTVDKDTLSCGPHPHADVQHTHSPEAVTHSGHSLPGSSMRFIGHGGGETCATSTSILCLEAAETEVVKCTLSLPAPEVGGTHSLAPARSCKGETQCSSGSTGHLLLPLLPCCEHISLNRAALNKYVELCWHGVCESLIGTCGHA